MIEALQMPFTTLQAKTVYSRFGFGGHIMNPYYYQSEFRMNEGSDDFVYYSKPMGVYIHITKEQFLADNPGLSEDDFQLLKSWSDADLQALYQHDRREGEKLTFADDYGIGMKGTYNAPQWVIDIELRTDLESVLKRILTKTQYRRIVLYGIVGLTTQEIAKLEGCSQQAISSSIVKIRERLKKHFQGYL